MNQESFENRKKIILDIVGSKEYKPMKIKELAIILNVKKEEREDLSEVLNALVSEGKIILTPKGKYKKISDLDLIGEFHQNARGFGFVSVEGMENDIFISKDDIGNALDGDLVQIKITKEGVNDKKSEGKIVKIIKHNLDEVVGVYEAGRGFGFVKCDNKNILDDIYIPKNKNDGAMTGHKVVVKITDFGTEERKPEGEVIEILGHINDPGVDILSIVRAKKIPAEYPEEVMDYVAGIEDKIDESEISNRKDLRDVLMVTIDGLDAKDLDDAVSLEMDGEDYILGVHIADVSHYVKENSCLDKEAIKRGTSVYLVDRVIPMLPHKLSNGLCSLNAGEDRLALSCIMTINKKGSVIKHEIVESLVNINKRMDYPTVNKIIEFNDKEAEEENKDVVPMLVKMNELALLLRKKRHSNGSLDFDFPESKIELDEKGNPIAIKPYERNLATKLIEDFMLIANETVAEDYYWQDLPFVYRIHDNPDMEKMQRLELFINNFGYGIKTSNNEVHPKEIQKLLEKIEGTSEEAIISRLTLRSLKQARYSTECSGHFGLAASYYCHFTSPIRRYPDLQIHRIIKENLRHGISPKRLSHYAKILPEIAENSSKTERRADEAERDVLKLKKVQYMMNHIGEVYEGVISSITSFGAFVELDNTVEGLIRMTAFDDDYYFFDEENYELVGKDTKNTYKLGERIKIVVTSVSREELTIDFKPYKDEDEKTDE